MVAPTLTSFNFLEEAVLLREATATRPLPDMANCMFQSSMRPLGRPASISASGCCHRIQGRFLCVFLARREFMQHRGTSSSGAASPLARRDSSVV
jgi:hypothetical protein